MLSVNNVSVVFGGETLFEDFSFRLNPGDKVGLIGKNGAGKSTLLKILAGEQQPDSGEVSTDKEVSVGFLKQDIDFSYGKTVLEETYRAFSNIKKIEQEIEAINNQLANRTDYETESYNNLIIKLNELNHQYEVLGGYNYVGETEKVLQGLGFSRDDFNKLTDTFSGGWRMRIELAKLLLQDNQVLLLDEPTNHLDIDSIIWLEQFLKAYTGAVVIVSHDKMFLDTVTNRTIEISLGKLYDFNKPYSKYIIIREEMREQQRNAQKNQQKQIQQTERLIERFRAKASKATMAQSLIKKLEKIDRIEVDDEDTAVMNLQFPVAVQPGKVVIEAKNVSKSYSSKQVLKNINLLIERGSKTAFVGQNGQGKTTLAKIIVGEIDFEGELKLGHNVKIGYFAQNQAEYLDGNKTLLEIMEEAANDSNRAKVRDMLGSFLFSGDDVTKKVKVLSGGERNRLALCKMLLEPFNVLVMDEPTNHLDIKSKQVLKQALQNFEGTLLVVSHDRDFLQGLTNKVYEFKNKGIKEYLGDVNYYLETRNVESFREIEKQIQPKEQASTKQVASGKLSYEAQREKKAIKNKINKIENKIAHLETVIAELDAKLAANYDEVSANPDFFKSYELKKQELESLMLEWEQLQEQLESI